MIKNDEKFLELLVNKLKADISLFEITKSKDLLAEVEEVIEFIKMTLGFPSLWELREDKKERYGLFWKRFNVKVDFNGLK